MQYTDIQRIWYETPSQNWTALRRTLQYHVNNEFDGLEDVTVDKLLRVVSRMESAAEPYPQSVDDLYNVLYNQV